MSPTLSHTPTENSVREQIIETCRRLDGAGLNTGRAGNLSAWWDRGNGAGMLITPSAMHYDAMGIDDIVWMPLTQPAKGVTAFGEHAPSSEWRMHQALYLAQPETRAVLHVHSPFATTLACLPKIHAQGIPAFHYMVAVAGGNTIRCAPYQTFGTQALSDAMCQAMVDRRACLLANHGQIAIGKSIGSAFDLSLEVESLARLYWQSLQLGEPTILTDTQMDAVRTQFQNNAYRDDA